MNKQELIEGISHLPSDCSRPRPMIDKLTALELIKLLDEPQKVTVPQFVADWIEECKNDDFHLFGAMEEMSLHQKKLDYWFREDDNMELFARAWLFGYTVEEEKRYLVKMNGLNSKYTILTYIERLEQWMFSDGKIDTKYYRKIHTRKELEQDNFGWVFDSPGIEIEEVG
jgi:hypothetical protein